MKVYKLKNKQEVIYLPDHYPQEIKNDSLSYFLSGEGWKKTKKFEIIDDPQLPNLQNHISWIDVAKAYWKYGMEVANLFAEQKVAGIVSRSYARAYAYLYRAGEKYLEHIPDVDTWFDVLIRPDHIFVLFGLGGLDIEYLDKKFTELDKCYDGEQCTYMGKPCSLREYIVQKYSEVHAQWIDSMLVIMEV